MKNTYTIDEILIAVDDISSTKKRTYVKLNKPTTKLNNSDIPKNTLSLIEEAEKNIKSNN